MLIRGTDLRKDAGMWPVLACVLVSLAAPASAAASGQACSGNPGAPLPIHLTVQGADAKGLYVLPAKRPGALVVFGHGYSYNTDGWRNHMIRAATTDGALAVTMNYRGLTDLPADQTGYQRSRGWPVKAGSQDLIAAARYFDRECGPFKRIILLGVSMGGNSTGLAAAARAKRIDGSPLFDYWVGIEGVYNLTELYFEASLLAPTSAFAANAKADIEAETGGPYQTNMAAYTERTVVDRAQEIATSGLKGVYVVHGVEDGEAGYNQAQELTNLLRADGMPTDLYSVTKRAPGDTPDTTLSGYAGVNSGNAGHGPEWSMHHVVLDTGFDRITASLVRGEPPPCNRTFIVDGTANPRISPDPATQVAGCPAGQRVLGTGRACPRATGSLTSHALGRVRLGMKRARARRLMGHFSTRGRRYMDFFCLSMGGIRVGYPPPRLLRTVSANERRRVQGRIVIALTANPHYALRGVHVGVRFAAVARRLRAGRPFHIGVDYWYLVPKGHGNELLRVRRGVIQEIGIADKRLTGTRHSARRLLKSFF